jgi:hypothetical protein
MTPEKNLEALTKDFMSALNRRDETMAKHFMTLIEGGWLVLLHYETDLADLYEAHIKTLRSLLRDSVAEWAISALTHD